MTNQNKKRGSPPKTSRRHCSGQAPRSSRRWPAGREEAARGRRLDLRAEARRLRGTDHQGRAASRASIQKEQGPHRDVSGVAAAGQRLNADQAVVDGEIVALDAQGSPSFQALQHRGSHPGHQIVFYAFDLLHLDGMDLTGERLRCGEPTCNGEGSLEERLALIELRSQETHLPRSESRSVAPS